METTFYGPVSYTLYAEQDVLKTILLQLLWKLWVMGIVIIYLTNNAANQLGQKSHIRYNNASGK